MDIIIMILSHQLAFVIYGALIVFSIAFKTSGVAPKWYSKVFWYILVPLSVLAVVMSIYLSWWA